LIKNLKWICLPAGMLLVLSMTVTSLYAHHGRGATYDMKKRVTLKGTVDDSHGDVTSADVNNFADAVNNSATGSKNRT